MKSTIHETQAEWRVWSRPHRRQPWRVVATAPTKPAAGANHVRPDDRPRRDWLVTAPDALDPNIRPAHLRG